MVCGMNIALGHIQTRTQKVAVSFEVQDFENREFRHMRQQFLKDCEEAEKRGGCFFNTMGEIARQKRNGMTLDELNALPEMPYEPTFIYRIEEKMGLHFRIATVNPNAGRPAWSEDADPVGYIDANGVEYECFRKEGMLVRRRTDPRR